MRKLGLVIFFALILTFSSNAAFADPGQAVGSVEIINPNMELFCGKSLQEWGQSGANIIHGTNGSDVIQGTNGIDVILAKEGDDIVYGKDGDDCIVGGPGKDRLYGNKGNDDIFGGDGNDNIDGNKGNDLVDGGNNTDHCKGGSGNNIIQNCERGDGNTGEIKQISGTIRDFKASHPDMEQGCSGQLCSGVTQGIVKTILGSDNKPVFNYDTVSTNGAANFNQWYNDAPGVNQARPFSIPLTQSSSDPNIYTFNSGDGFFPIDGKMLGNEGRAHNYHFTIELHSTFEFENGQKFQFTGDDDVWVFIDKKLVMDLGGTHPKKSATVTANNLVALGLVPGQTYQIDIFFAERQTTQSNFRIDTSLDFS